MPAEVLSLSVLALGWSVYLGMHSLLAANWFKQKLTQRLPWLTAWYRLLYNLLALLLLWPLLAGMEALAAPPLWQVEGPWRWLSWAVGLLGVAIIVLSLRDYDMQHFLGLRQLRNSGGADQANSAMDEGTLVIKGVHRFVRHPWYAGALLIIWSQPMDTAHLLSACLWSAYLLLGYRLEETRLLAAHGQNYAEYQSKVPALVPWLRPLLRKYLQ